MLMPEPDMPSEVSSTKSEAVEFEVLSAIVQALQPLPLEARQRVLASVATFLGIAAPVQAKGPHGGSARSTAPGGAEGHSSFSEDRTPSPKEFLFQKRPQTDIDRVAALAYYLTHYLQMPHFKTLDLSKLNTEAAQLKFSNTAYAVDNATRAGLLVPASKGAKQLSALGELYVQALPDRAAARNAIAHARPKKKRRGSKGIPQIDDDLGNGGES
jgi:hypothetical protein